MNLTYLIAAAMFVFVMMYDTKSGRLEKFMRVPQKNAQNTGCCNNNVYMSTNPTQCENAHYQGVQFADRDYGCPERHPKVCGGAIIAP